MEKPVKGDVVVVPFPFTDLSKSSRRPALVVADLHSNDDIILTQITGRRRYDGYSIPLTNDNFLTGGLDIESNIRPNRLFTSDSKIVIKIAGKLSQEKTDEVINKIIEIVKS